VSSAVDGCYLYACFPNPNVPEELNGGSLASPCRVARVPVRDVAEGTRYHYWNGVDWVADPLQASVVISGLGGLTVSFNRYLGKFLAVHTSTPNGIVLRWADRPEGTWHMLGRFDTLPGKGIFGTSYQAVEHPALRDACERSLYVTYALEVADDDDNDDAGAAATHPETRLVCVELK
jgi:hypothetical protein